LTGWLPIKPEDQVKIAAKEIELKKLLEAIETYKQETLKKLSAEEQKIKDDAAAA
jgi:hypothetical protein